MTSTARTVLRDRNRVRPSHVDRATTTPFTLDQELKPFGEWVGDPIWAPPKDASEELADSMLEQPSWFRPMGDRWEAVVDAHRGNFTQVREIELRKASIRLPKGRLFVKVTGQADFASITDAIPDCVQTRLNEFLAGPETATASKSITSNRFALKSTTNCTLRPAKT